MKNGWVKKRKKKKKEENHGRYADVCFQIIFGDVVFQDVCKGESAAALFFFVVCVFERYVAHFQGRRIMIQNLKPLENICLISIRLSICGISLVINLTFKHSF